jgi:hypothetical protein
LLTLGPLNNTLQSNISLGHLFTLNQTGSHPLILIILNITQVFDFKQVDGVHRVKFIDLRQGEVGNDWKEVACKQEGFDAEGYWRVVVVYDVLYCEFLYRLVLLGLRSVFKLLKFEPIVLLILVSLNLYTFYLKTGNNFCVFVCKFLKIIDASIVRSFKSDFKPQIVYKVFFGRPPKNCIRSLCLTCAINLESISGYFIQTKFLIECDINVVTAGSDGILLDGPSKSTQQIHNRIP